MKYSFNDLAIFDSKPAFKARTNLNHFKTLYNIGYEKNVKKATLEGYEWLREKYPKEYGSYWHQTRALSTFNKLTWKIVKGVEEKQILHKTKKLLKLIP